MEELKKLDKVAYVRFASVYRHFRDINEFANELKDLLKPERMKSKGDQRRYENPKELPLWLRKLPVFSLPAFHARSPAHEPDISVTPIAHDGQVLVSFDLSDGMTPDVRNDSERPLPTTFPKPSKARRSRRDAPVAPGARRGAPPSVPRQPAPHPRRHRRARRRAGRAPGDRRTARRASRPTSSASSSSTRSRPPT